MALPYKIKKYISFIVLSMFPSLAMMIGLVVAGQLGVLITFPLSLLISFIIASLILRNPFTNMLEGKGILCQNIDSTGIIQFFNLQVNPPKITGRFRGKEINDIWDRNCSSLFIPPQKNQGYASRDSNGDWTLKVRNEEFQKSKMSYAQFPVLLYNDTIKSLITKDFLSNVENSAFANHPILKLNDLVGELNSHLRNFGRYLVDQLKPMGEFFKSKAGFAVMVIIVIFVIIMLIAGGPTILSSLQSGLTDGVTAGKAAGGAISTISPLG